MKKKREVCYVVGARGRVLWSDAGGLAVLPDSSARWQAIWSRRDQVTEIAHSHPLGPLFFSREDETTMAAIASALGWAPRFSVVSPRGMLCREGARTFRVINEPAWAERLRRESGME